MSFAQKILEKYGWKEGEGLGKNCDGIAKPLKASLKFDNAGLGVDKAAEFNNHWWERVFNEAANNVEIKKEDGKVSVNVKNDESVEITTKDYSVRKMKKKKHDSYDNFLSSSTLTNTGDEVSNPDKIQVDEIAVAPYKPLTDAELFAACGGRTAHKGARHGLKLSGKLARIEQQEKEMLLKIQGKTTEATIVAPMESWTVVKSKKKKKNKEKPEEASLPEEDSKLNDLLYTTEYCIKSKKKRKEKKKTEEELSNCLGSFTMENADENESLFKLCDNSKAIKKSKKEKKGKKKHDAGNWDSYRDVNDGKENGDDSIEKEPEEIADLPEIDFEENTEVEVRKRKSKKCKHGIDKEAKEAHKKAKKMRKNLKHVTEDLERAVALTA